MKSSSFGISAIFCLGLFAGTVLAEEGGVQAFDRSTACLTARLLLERVREDVLKEAQPAEALMSAMTNAPGTYVRTAEAREALRPVYRQAVEAQYAKEAGAVLDKLAKGASREDAFGADFAQAAVLLPADRVDAAVRRDYDRQFQTARKQACALQRNAIVTNLRPTEQEFETTDRQALKTKLSDRIIAGQTFPVFEENRPYVSNEIVEPMLRAAEAQRNEQRDWLQQSRLEHWTPVRMERELRDGLQTHSATVSKQRTEKGEIAYGLFPSVVAGIPEVAQKRAAERLARTIRETRIQTMPVDFLAVIEKNPGAHRTREDSLKAFRPALTETLQKQTLDRVPSLVPEPERAEFTAWANTCFAQHEETRKTVSEVVDHVLMPQVEAARKQCAEQQVKQLFPELVDGSWVPDAALVDAVCAQPDWHAAMRGWKEYAQLEDFARMVREQPLMEESEARVQVLLEQGFNRGRTARNRQHAIVDEVFPAIRDAYEKGEGMPEFKEIVQRYRTQVQDQWQEEAEDVLWQGVAAEQRPENFAAQFRALFRSTDERIELRARSLFDAVVKLRQEEQKRQQEQRQQEQQQQEQQKQEPQEQTPPETPPEVIEMLCAFELSRNRNGIVIRCLVDETPIAETTCTESQRQFSDRAPKAAQEITARFAQHLKNTVPSGAKLTVRTSVRVRDPFVYYGMVTELSRVLRSSIQTFADDGVELQLGATSADGDDSAESGKE